MSVLLHTCCAPCLSGSRYYFEENGIEYTVFWYNPNIFPDYEIDKRYKTLCDFDEIIGFPMIKGKDTDNEIYRSMIDRYALDPKGLDDIPIKVESRCDICYWMRLKECAIKGSDMGSEGFSTTLLLSKYQKHDRIRYIGKEIENEFDIDFHYADLRKYWGRSLDGSRKYRLYRQRYCGCELSLKEGLARSRGIGVKGPLELS